MDWKTSGASIPGEWDYIAWIEGESWDDVWNHLVDVKEGDGQTFPCVPIKSWWNQSWKGNWW